MNGAKSDGWIKTRFGRISRVATYNFDANKYLEKYIYRWFNITSLRSLIYRKGTNEYISVLTCLLLIGGFNLKFLLIM